MTKFFKIITTIMQNFGKISVIAPQFSYYVDLTLILLIGILLKSKTAKWVIFELEQMLEQIHVLVIEQVVLPHKSSCMTGINQLNAIYCI